MGAGKSTVGRRLAERTGLQFIDSDDEIVKAAGCSITDIFALHGEEIFRDLEQRVMGRLLVEGPIILATGGGAWVQEGIRSLITDHAISVWLHAQLPVLLERVSRRNHRPLLETGDKELILQRLIDERYPLYAKADVTVESDEKLHEAVVEAVINQVEEYIQNT